MPKLLPVDELVPKALHDALTFLRKLIRGDESVLKELNQSPNKPNLEQRLKAALTMLKFLEQGTSMQGRTVQEKVNPADKQKLLKKFKAIMNGASKTPDAIGKL